MTLKNYHGAKFQLTKGGQIWFNSAMRKGKLIGCSKSQDYGDNYVYFSPDVEIFPVKNSWE